MQGRHLHPACVTCRSGPRGWGLTCSSFSTAVRMLALGRLPSGISSIHPFSVPSRPPSMKSACTCKARTPVRLGELVLVQALLWHRRQMGKQRQEPYQTLVGICMASTCSRQAWLARWVGFVFRLWVSCSAELGRCTFLFVKMRCISGMRPSLATAGRCCLLASISASAAASILLRKPSTRVCRSAGARPLWTAHKLSSVLHFLGKAVVYCSRSCSMQHAALIALQGARMRYGSSVC